MDYKEVIDKLVRELSYRVGIPNIENKEHQSIMSEILSEWGEYDIKQTIFEFLTEKDGEEDSSEDKKFTNTGGSGYVKAQDYTKWKSDPKGFDGPKFTKTPSGKYIPQKDGEGEEGGEEEKELGKSLKDKSYQQKVKKEKEISDKIQKEKEGKSSSDSEEKTDNEKSFDELKKDIANNPDIIKDLKSFEKFLDNKQKEALKLEGKKRVKELEKLDSLSESFDNLPDDVKNTTSSIFAKGQIFEGRQNSGIGKNRLGYLDVKTLASNKEYLMKSYGDGSAEAVKEFVQQSRKIKVNEDYVKSSFDLLPVSLQKSLQGKGKVGDAGKNKHFLGYVRNDGEITSDKNDPNIKKGEDGKLEVKRGNPGGKDRGRFVWRAILEQGGQDPYTGLPLDLSAIDLEHTVAFDNKDNGTPSAQDYLDREHDDNIIICATNINQKKSNLSMKEFYERIVDGQIGKSEEEFTKESETYETINNVASQTEQKAALILEGGKIKKGYDFKILKQTFDGDDDTYTNARDEFRKVAKTKEDKKALAKLKSGIGKNTLMAMGLGRGLTDKSGRRTIKLSSDNLYRGFLLSMADEPDRQDEYKKAWEEARKVGNSDEYRLKGKGQQGMIKYLIDKKFISHKVLSDKKMGKVFQNSLTEVFDYDLNEYIILN